jgi:hypothetical protein
MRARRVRWLGAWLWVVLMTTLIAPGAAAAKPKAPPAQGVRADFNGDGRTDLAIADGKTEFATASGAEDVGGAESAGAVNVVYGSKNGLTADGNQLFAQGQGGVPGTSGPFESFGIALAAGDFNGDKRADLAIGDSAEDVGAAQSAGAVVVLYGSQNGLQPAGSQLLAQGEGGALGSSGGAEDFGIELAAADFNGDKLVDLAAADNDEDVGGTEDAGSVNVIFGSPGGLNPAANQLLAQGVDGLPGASGSNEAFGTGLAAGRFDKGKLADLAIGDPSETVGGAASAGSVNVVYGSAGGLSAGQLFAQGAGGLAGASGDSESFGGELAAGDFDADKRDDLAAGDPDEDVGGAESAGAVNAMYGS